MTPKKKTTRRKSTITPRPDYPVSLMPYWYIGGIVFMLLMACAVLGSK